MAPRLIWTLHVYGHTNTYLLDGHYEQWEQSGKEIETGAAPAVEPSEYKVISADDHSINVDKDAVINKSEDTVLLDALNAALNELKADGTLDAIVANYITAE